ncbi:ATP-dependent DNA helicase PIF1-like [Rhizophagus irregularis DAOM 181602=DAOM 197198]|nr:ATP-dependent DNA helicase PIF1-like [Rhizophagus irregularis DAOM 181602=DAOM 197198]
MLRFIDMRLREAFSENKNKPFGRRSVILFGGFCQLAPVLNVPMHFPLSVYRQFKEVYKLDIIQWQSENDQQGFRDILLRLQDGKSMLNDWNILISRFKKNLNRAEHDRFQDVVFIHTTWAKVYKVNIKMLRRLNWPITKICAVHSSERTAKCAKTNIAKGLEVEILLGRTQLPISITVHKSQSLTLDKVNIDIGVQNLNNLCLKQSRKERRRGKIQYSTNSSGSSSNIKEHSFFGGISIKKDKKMCQGNKFCQFTDQEFVNQKHYSVDFDSETFKKRINQGFFTLVLKNNSLICAISSKSQTVRILILVVSEVSNSEWPYRENGRPSKLSNNFSYNHLGCYITSLDLLHSKNFCDINGQRENYISFKKSGTASEDHNDDGTNGNAPLSKCEPDMGMLSRKKKDNEIYVQCFNPLQINTNTEENNKIEKEKDANIAMGFENCPNS